MLFSLKESTSPPPHIVTIIVLYFTITVSAYNVFFREERARLMEQRKQEGSSELDRDGGSLFSALGKIIARRWKELCPEEMARYTEAANDDMKRYRREMDGYQ
jgi:HMG (high mobility group) box